MRSAVNGRPSAALRALPSSCRRSAAPRKADGRPRHAGRRLRRRTRRPTALFGGSSASATPAFAVPTSGARWRSARPSGSGAVVADGRLRDAVSGRTGGSRARPATVAPLGLRQVRAVHWRSAVPSCRPRSGEPRASSSCRTPSRPAVRSGDAAVRDAFGRRRDLFSEFADWLDHTRVGGAMRSRWCFAARRCCAKVQHEGVDPLMLWTWWRRSRSQADRVDRPPLRHLPHGDAGVLPPRCTFPDFRVEAASFPASGGPDSAPSSPSLGDEPWSPSLSAQRVFAMSYEEGFKVTDGAALAARRRPRGADGARGAARTPSSSSSTASFNADPHAGNLMRPSARPLAARPRPPADGAAAIGSASSTRASRCRLRRWTSAASSPPSARSASRRTRGDPARDLEFWRFFLRDTRTRDEARKQPSGLLQDARGAARQQGRKRGHRFLPVRARQTSSSSGG